MILPPLKSTIFDTDHWENITMEFAKKNGGHFKTLIDSENA